MRIILDTHIVCWHFYDPGRLTHMASKLIREAEESFVSAASIWEIAIKARVGKIAVNPHRILQKIEQSGLYALPVLARHTVAVADMPRYHNDPFDRLLVAQAMSEQMHLLTADSVLKQYSDLVIEV